MKSPSSLSLVQCPHLLHDVFFFLFFFCFYGCAGSSLRHSLSLVAANRGYSLAAVQWLLIALASLVAVHGL